MVIPITEIVLLLITSVFGVYWGSANRETITIKAAGFESKVQECLTDGLEARIRFDMRLCRGGAVWFDSCTDARAETHTISFDSITDSYRVVSDRFGDESAPVAVGIPSRIEAIGAMLTVDGVLMSFLARENEEILADPKSYIQIRGTYSCKGSVNRTLARLSQIFTLGIINAVETTTDWADFKLSSGVANLPQ